MENSSATLAHLLHLAQHDVRLAPDLTVYMALCCAWVQQAETLPIRISRRSIMRHAHVRSIATYHKCIRELEQWKYINYKPSYHPLQGSAVYLCSLTESLAGSGFQPKKFLVKSRTCRTFAHSSFGSKE